MIRRASSERVGFGSSLLGRGFSAGGSILQWGDRNRSRPLIEIKSVSNPSALSRFLRHVGVNHFKLTCQPAEAPRYVRQQGCAVWRKPGFSSSDLMVVRKLATLCCGYGSAILYHVRRPPVQAGAQTLSVTDGCRGRGGDETILGRSLCRNHDISPRMNLVHSRRT
jgi:hypothetical protein